MGLMSEGERTPHIAESEKRGECCGPHAGSGYVDCPCPCHTAEVAQVSTPAPIHVPVPAGMHKTETPGVLIRDTLAPAHECLHSFGSGIGPVAMPCHDDPPEDRVGVWRWRFCTHCGAHKQWDITSQTEKDVEWIKPKLAHHAPSTPAGELDEVQTALETAMAFVRSPQSFDDEQVYVNLKSAWARLAAYRAGGETK